MKSCLAGALAISVACSVSAGAQAAPAPVKGIQAVASPAAENQVSLPANAIALTRVAVEQTSGADQCATQDRLPSGIGAHVAGVGA